MAGQTAQQIAAARIALAAGDPGLARAHAVAPDFAWRTKTCGLPGLVRLVIDQQVSTLSAAAIWQRFEHGIGAVTSDAILAQGIDGLRCHGLSGPKARSILAIAGAEASGRIDFTGIGVLSDADAISKLMALHGVGLWTAETYLMMCEGRTDILPAGDLALQEGLRLADGGEFRPGARALAARAQSWRPWRSVAAHLLWSYYATVRRGATAGR